MSEYKSSVLTCNVEDDSCPVCRFLNEKDHWSDWREYVDDLLHVIGVLDRELAKSEEAVMNLAAMPR